MNIKKANLYVITAYAVVFLAMTIAANVVINHWSGALEVYFGRIGSTGISDFETEYATDEELLQAEIDGAVQIVEEGATLLKNEGGALPLAAGTNVSLFSQSSVDWIGGNVAGSDTAESVVTLKDVLEEEGINVNSTLWDFYKSTGNRRDPGGNNGYGLHEADWATVSSAASSSFSSYHDAAIVVFSRVNTEGSDQATDMSRWDGEAGDIYMKLSATERGLLKGIKEAGFGKIIVLINSAVPLQLDFMQDESYGISAALLCSATGNNGLTGLGKVIAGIANPSGHLVDTYVYDNYSAPATQNLGDNRYVNAAGEVMEYSYLNYAENIYVGYRYFETRYEDKIKGRDNVGDYDYSSTVAFPFGYGMSYTTFDWTDYTMTSEGSHITVSVKVTNTGNIAGKDVVAIYFQSPYTDYDIVNGVEKASVVLAAFDKTNLLSPGESQEVVMSFNAETVMKSYDSEGAKGYILEEGDYCITAAQDAHAAVNNILAFNGFTDLQAAGETPLVYDADKVAVYKVASFTHVGEDEVTGTSVSNQFDYARVTDDEYLTRNNWSMMDNNGLDYSTGTQTVDYYILPSCADAQGTVGTHPMNDELLANLQAVGWDASGRPASEKNDSPAVINSDDSDESELTLVQLRGAPYEDERWQILIEQLKVSEIHGLFNQAGWSTKPIESIQMPGTSCNDGPTGLGNFVSGWTSYRWPCETLIASTWNTDMAYLMGSFVGEDGLRTGVAGWYAPAMNLHRTAFGGRASEYYSEDPLLSGYMGANTVSGAQEKGLFTFIKHFAVNEQDINRGDISMWSTEQAMRELYFKPFEITVKEGRALGVMDSQTRLGYRFCKGNYDLLTTVLRNEWGFQGTVVTDYTSDGGAMAEQCLAAGTDLMLSSAALRVPDTKADYIRHALQDAAFHTAYVVSNSSLMNGLAGGASYSAGFPVYVLILIIVDVVMGLIIILAEFFAWRSYLKDRKNTGKGAKA